MSPRDRRRRAPFRAPGVSAWAAPQNTATRRREQNAEREVSSLDQRLEAASLVHGSGRSVDSRRCARPAVKVDRRRRAGDVEGRTEKSLGYARSASLSLDSATEDSTTRAPSRAEIVTSRQPIRPGKAPIAESESFSVPRRGVHDVEPQASRDLRRPGERPPVCPTTRRGLRRPSSASSRSLAKRAGKPVACTLDGELEGRDLGEVEGVVDVDGAARRARFPRSG